MERQDEDRPRVFSFCIILRFDRLINFGPHLQDDDAPLQNARYPKILTCAASPAPA